MRGLRTTMRQWSPVLGRNAAETNPRRSLMMEMSIGSSEEDVAFTT
jgi:hypothetical protein